ncbi:poly-beta-1,6-N-acetyl-D-glucosamine synthase [Salinicoccus roseus]|uniref:poly-beta-1,6-N-acetyl-D-glucosamine synthase n=1 Tax=Salinicoccus roseus TaxID=45670 RepID=UPI002300E4BE|nr:poly-beta-1,6-N-acetyl-D-glucosamine synthase [Salinicoccus roseus]
MQILLDLLLFYPIVISVFWLIGTIMFFVLREVWLSRKIDTDKEDVEGITFIVPCYNEADTIKETIVSLDALKYTQKEIMVVNDGSSDRSSEVLNELNAKYDFTFIDLKVNRGKANALNTAVENASHDYVMVIDADTMVDDAAPYYMMENFKKLNNIGAVTGNPRIRNKSSLLAKIQTVEYASIIGCIKRAQVLTGFVNTISGVFTLFDKKALKDVGYFDTDMITEDIAVSWKFHFAGYKIQYEPRALCWMLVPETFRGLFTQRLRWAQGGQEVLIRDFKNMLKVKNPSLWILYLEQVFSVIWVYSIIATLLYALLSTNFLDYYFYAFNLNLVFLSAFVLTFVNVIQFTISVLIDSRYEKKNLLYIVFLSWYPVFYWLINAVVAVIALPRAIKRKKGEFATWKSPDRGDIQQSNQI